MSSPEGSHQETDFRIFGKLVNTFADHINVNTAELDVQSAAPGAYEVFKQFQEEVDLERFVIIGGLAAREAWIMHVDLEDISSEDFRND